MTEQSDSDSWASWLWTEVNPVGRDHEGEHNIFDWAGAAVTYAWNAAPASVRVTAFAITATYGAIFDAGGQASNGFTMRDGFQLAGGIIGGFAGLIGGGGFGSAVLGVGGTLAGGRLGGDLYDLMFDRDAQPVVPNRPTPRPSDANIQQSRDIVDGVARDVNGDTTYPDDIIRRVAAAQTQREQDIAAAAAAKAAAEAAAWQQEYNRDRQGGGARHPHLARIPRQNTPRAPRRGEVRIALGMKPTHKVAQIIGVNQGRVVEQGTYATLMAARGVYWGLNGDE